MSRTLRPITNVEISKKLFGCWANNLQVRLILVWSGLPNGNAFDGLDRLLNGIHLLPITKIQPFFGNEILKHKINLRCVCVSTKQSNKFSVCACIVVAMIPGAWEARANILHMLNKLSIVRLSVRACVEASYFTLWALTPFFPLSFCICIAESRFFSYQNVSIVRYPKTRMSCTNHSNWNGVE